MRVAECVTGRKGFKEMSTDTIRSHPTFRNMFRPRVTGPTVPSGPGGPGDRWPAMGCGVPGPAGDVMAVGTTCSQLFTNKSKSADMALCFFMIMCLAPSYVHLPVPGTQGWCRVALVSPPGPCD